MAARNAILDALLVQMAGPGNLFPTQGRKVLYWSDVDLCPALFIRSSSEHWPRRPTGQPPVKTMGAQAFVYARDVGTTAAALILEDLCDAIDQNMQPSSPILQVQTLGGLVQHAWIEGEIIKSPGEMTGEAIALIPVMILVP